MFTTNTLFDPKLFFRNSVSIFGGLPLPWTMEQTNKINKPTEVKISDQEKAKAGKKLSEAEMKRLQATLAKPIVTKSATTSYPTEKKKLFGIW
jgi:hypothetical protein